MPTRSPDLFFCEYFLWGYVKYEVYKHRPTTIEELKSAIRGTGSEGKGQSPPSRPFCFLESRGQYVSSVRKLVQIIKVMQQKSLINRSIYYIKGNAN